MRIQCLLIGFGIILTCQGVTGETGDSVVVRRFFDEALTHKEAYRNLEALCREAPGRICGSAALNTAIRLEEEALKEAGADTVYLQPVMIPNWKPGHSTEAVMAGTGYALHVVPLGNSVGTSPEGITAPVVEVHDFDDLASLGQGKISGRIVFFDRPMDPTLINTFRAYSGAVDQRVRGASQASRYGAVAVLVRSMTTLTDDAPHTGVMHYQEGIEKIPALALSTKDADMLSGQLKKTAALTITIRADCATGKDTLGYNVIGEIYGRQPGKGIIVVGGHLDAWFNAQGAHDDGAGSVQSVEVIRLFHATGITPVHTLRCVLYMDEENRQSGGKTYAKQAARKGEKHVFALESDRGGLLPRGFTFDTSGVALNRLIALSSYFKPYGITEFIKGGSGTDISPLKAVHPILAGLYTDSQRYFDYHHSANDSFDKVNFRELQLGSAAMASLLYLVDRNF